MKENLSALLKAAQKKIAWLKDKKQDLNLNISKIEEYSELQHKKEGEMQELLKQHDKIDADIKNYERILGDRELMLSQIDMNISKIEILKNVKFVKSSYEEKSKEKELIIQELEGRKKIQEEIAKQSGKYHEMLGEAKNLTNLIQAQEKDLSLPQYKNIDGSIQFLQYQMIAAEKMAEAILRRHDAIEEGVMVFHNKKMELINKVIKDLWKLTYKGKDIDTIEIKSDMEKSASRFHSFNYRIVFKNTEYVCP